MFFGLAETFLGWIIGVFFFGDVKWSKKKHFWTVKIRQVFFFGLVFPNMYLGFASEAALGICSQIRMWLAMWNTLIFEILFIGLV